MANFICPKPWAYVKCIDYSLPCTDYRGGPTLLGVSLVRSLSWLRPGGGWQGPPTSPELGIYIKNRTVGSWHSSPLYRDSFFERGHSIHPENIVTLSSLSLWYYLGDHRWNWLKCSRSRRVIQDRLLDSGLFLHSSLSCCFYTKLPTSSLELS